MVVECDTCQLSLGNIKVNVSINVVIESFLSTIKLLFICPNFPFYKFTSFCRRINENCQSDMIDRPCPPPYTHLLFVTIVTSRLDLPGSV